VLKADEIVDFIPGTEEYGRAEFVICPVYKRGKMRELYIYPAQQPDAKFYYKVNLEYAPLDFSVSSWTHKGMSNPVIWLMFWCKEHKCQAFRVYVPGEAKRFSVSMLSNVAVQFDV